MPKIHERVGRIKTIYDMKQTLLILATLFGIAVAEAQNVYDFKEGKLFYKISGQEVTVVSQLNRVDKKTQSYYSEENVPMGEITVPASVSNAGKVYRVTKIDEYVFAECKQLNSIVIGNNVTEIGKFAFLKCVGLNSVMIGSSVTAIREKAFSQCENLNRVTLPGSLRTLGELAFSYCSNLKECKVFWSVPPAINSNVFEGINKSVVTLAVPTFTTPNYKKANVWREFRIHEEDVFNVSTGSLNLKAEGESKSIEVQTNIRWQASADNWLKLTPASGNASVSMKIEAGKNPSTKERTTTITFTAGTSTHRVTVRQAASEPELIVSPAKLTFAGEGGDKQLTITSNTDWTISSDDSWLTLPNPATDSGNKKISIRAVKNPKAAARAGKLLIKSGSIVREVAVTQEPGTSALSITLSEAGIRVWSTEGTLHISDAADVLQVYNIAGTRVAQLPAMTGKQSIELPAGLYMLRSGKAAGKVVVK